MLTSLRFQDNRAHSLLVVHRVESARHLLPLLLPQPLPFTVLLHNLIDVVYVVRLPSKVIISALLVQRRKWKVERVSEPSFTAPAIILQNAARS